MKSTITLSKPDDFKRQRASDGSIVYPSGNPYVRDGVKIPMPDAGKYMLWVKDGEEANVAGVMVPFGHFVMAANGPEYFKSPFEALRTLREVREAETP